MSDTLGCAIIYRWRLKPGKEDQFREAWSRVTRLLMEQHGALGSRLHTANDGLVVAYAQWPSREARDASAALEPVDRRASEAMADAIASAESPIFLTPVEDHLVPIAARAPSPPSIRTRPT
ncbi:MAG: antibiotic biosynthesis monooxygenase [Phycisphaerales bacterium]|nr:MAG: antibiotic biosynthesis monooxygenase [Phycisphaerales bacterium]